MASVPVNVESKGSMWDLDHNLDQPMDEEAGRLRNMYQEKVRMIALFNSFISYIKIILFLYQFRRPPILFLSNSVTLVFICNKILWSVNKKSHSSFLPEYNTFDGDLTPT